MILALDLPTSTSRRLPVHRAALVLLLSTLCSGCLPLRFTTGPGASGKILDSQSHAPLGGAQVVISHSTYPPPSVEEAFTNRRSEVVTTDDTGQFSIPIERGWDFFVIPVDLFAPFGLVVVKKDGYEPVLLPVWSRSVKPLGDVLMKPTVENRVIQ